MLLFSRNFSEEKTALVHKAIKIPFPHTKLNTFCCVLVPFPVFFLQFRLKFWSILLKDKKTIVGT